MSTVPNAELADDLEQSAPELPKAKPGPRKVSLALINFWLDATLLLAVVFVGWVSAMMQVVFPAPTTAAGWVLWGLSYNQWRDLQFYGLCTCGLLALEHVVLHWNWICCIITTKILRLRQRPDEGSQAIYGVGTFILIMTFMLGSIGTAILMVKRPPG